MRDSRTATADGDESGRKSRGEDGDLCDVVRRVSPVFAQWQSVNSVAPTAAFAGSVFSRSPSPSSRVSRLQYLRIVNAQKPLAINSSRRSRGRRCWDFASRLDGRRPRTNALATALVHLRDVPRELLG